MGGEGDAEGTLVTMTYNFASVNMAGPLFCLINCMPSLLKYHLHSSIVSVWHMEMVRREHVPQKRPAFGNLKGDRSEEDDIRRNAGRDEHLGAQRSFIFRGVVQGGPPIIVRGRGVASRSQK